MQKLNFTTVPNVILDNMSDLTGAAVKVVMAIARKTIGWHKDTDWISNKVMLDMTGLSRPGMYKAVNELIDKGLIQKVINGEKGTEKVCYDLAFEGTVTQLQGDCNSVAPQKKLSKEKIYVEKSKELLDYLNNKAGRNFKVVHSCTINAVKQYSIVLLKSIVDYKTKEWGSDTKMKKYLRQDTLFRHSHLDTYLTEAEEGIKSNDLREW